MKTKKIYLMKPGNKISTPLGYVFSFQALNNIKTPKKK
jgi:hypothetical protein